MSPHNAIRCPSMVLNQSRNVQSISHYHGTMNATRHLFCGKSSYHAQRICSLMQNHILAPSHLAEHCQSAIDRACLDLILKHCEVNHWKRMALASSVVCRLCRQNLSPLNIRRFVHTRACLAQPVQCHTWKQRQRPRVPLPQNDEHIDNGAPWQN